MNILFVIPLNVKINTDGNNKEQIIKSVPYGVLSIATYIKANSAKEINIEVLDFNSFSYNDLEMCDILTEKIISFKPNILAVSVMFNLPYSYLNEFSKIAHCYDENILILAGGIVATNSFQQLLDENKYVDAVCYGEGEIPYLKLVNSNDIYDIIENDVSWITRKSILKGVKPQTSYINNLDEIPLLDFSLININSYGERLITKNLRKGTSNNNGSVIPIHTTRGCPFNCVFCCAGANHGKKVRYMSAERVVSDVEEMIKLYNLRKLSIDDDQFLFDTQRAKKILEGLSNLGIKIELASGISVAFIDDEIAYLLKKSGVDIVNLAIESGSDHVLKEIISKPLKVAQIKPAIASLRKYGLTVHAFFIIGFPNESEYDRECTLRLINEIGFDWSYIYIATPFKGSRLYDLCIENNYIDLSQNILDATTYNCVINAPNIDPEYITKKAYIMNLEVNFVKNYRMSIGDYEMAGGYFKSISEKYPNHAFAHYYLAKVYEKINEKPEIIQKHYDIYMEILNINEEWRNYAKYFNLIQ
ncbi:B12-binding domain-containing radical SAM protein [Clostridium gelidum]|uniref:B12-binding domain-containing radical SAM protein n=1 Tax=Clostridium gelidum TaxID=704125 RepID=A0ABM7T9L8_9CLOT|nr:radical SAM protein [Clostridium gelidum]BCZ48615.1 B12-binding domain-containing radical SAM protein [Clostridium gelidum]